MCGVNRSTYASSLENCAPAPPAMSFIDLSGLHLSGLIDFENNYFTEMCSGSEAGSYLRHIYFVYHSTLGLRVIQKNNKWAPLDLSVLHSTPYSGFRIFWPHEQYNNVKRTQYTTFANIAFVSGCS